MADEDNKRRTAKLLRRLREQGHFTPEDEAATPAEKRAPAQPGVSPFTLSDLDNLSIPENMPDLEKSNAEEVAEYIERLEAKMRAATADFAAGRINQAQFQAIYTRYREQREIIERMQRRNPQSDAWQRVATEGYTEFLLSQHEARVLGIAIFNNATGGLIKRLGQFDVPVEIMLSMLDNLSIAQRGTGDAVSTQIEDGRWLGMVHGRQSSSVVLYSDEPPNAVLGEVTFLHRDFERINEKALKEDQPNPTVMVFPQKRLFSK
jgi:hypothetical protein